MEERTDRVLTERTDNLVQALNYVLRAKAEIQSYLTKWYGEDNEDKIEKHYADVYGKDIDSLLLSIKIGIGDSIEENMMYLDTNEM